jgi:hypothetical protein
MVEEEHPAILIAFIAWVDSIDVVKILKYLVIHRQTYIEEDLYWNAEYGMWENENGDYDIEDNYDLRNALLFKFSQQNYKKFGLSIEIVSQILINISETEKYGDGFFNMIDDFRDKCAEYTEMKEV